MRLLPKRKSKKTETRKTTVSEQVRASRPKNSRLRMRTDKNNKRGNSSNLGKDFRKQRQRQKRFGFLSKVASFAKGQWQIGLVAFVIIVVGTIIVVGGVLLHDSEVFILKDVEITGNEQLSDLEIMSVVEPYINSGLFGFSTTALENKLTNDFPFIKSVEVRKILPSKLTVDVIERYPEIAYMNMSGVYLVDQDGYVVNVLKSEDVTALTSEEILVLSGYGDPNANYVYERYLVDIDDDQERAEVDWDEVPIEDKRKALEKERSELVAYVNSRLDTLLDVLAQSGFNDLVKIQAFDTEVIFTDDTEEDFIERYRMYQVGEQVDEHIFEISQQIYEFLEEAELPFTIMRWQSDFSLEVKLLDNVSLLFSSTRSIEQQLIALQTIREKGELRGASVVDLRSDIISVR